MRIKTATALNVAVVLLASLFSLIPFYIMVVMATRVSEEIYKGLVFVPGTHMLANIRTVLDVGFLRSYINSLYISVVATTSCVLTSSLAGFGFAFYKFKLKRFLFVLVVAFMMVPPQLGLIAYVIQMRFMGLSRTHLPLILVFVGNAFGVFWMTQYIKSSVPLEVVESARIDGCSEFLIYLNVVVPFIKPAISTLGVLVFMWSWNNYLLPLVIVNRPNLYTVPLAIASLNNVFRVDIAAQICGLALGTIPVVVLFIMASKTFIRGMIAGALKG